jgi:hypothetical protein
MSTEENVVLTTEQASAPKIRLADVEVTDQNVALNLMVSFLSLAQTRGTYTLDESAKIWECIKMFQIPSSPPNV